MADAAQTKGTKGDEDAHHPSSISAFSFSHISFHLLKKIHSEYSKT